MKFNSKVSIKIKAGDGGDGIISWRREAREAFGGPAGGNGGDGGSVYIQADLNLNSLYHLKSQKHFKSQGGENGKGKCMHGKNGEDLIIKVPCGTNINNLANDTKITELIFDQQTFLICEGGKGGKGNLFFKSSRRQTPFLYDKGDLGEFKEIELDLESIADVGFLGFPNAGKSTLLSRISNAKPKIASFPFTTLIPVLGTVEFEKRKLIFADIPGLIKGASDGLGLGFEFLKHLHRCKVILHIVSCDEEDPLINHIKVIEDEIRKYSDKLFEKPRLLVINKIDVLTEEELELIKQKIQEEVNTKVIFISAKETINIDELISESFSLFEKHETKPVADMDYMEFVDPDYKNETPEIWEESDVWFVTSHALKYWVNKIPQTTNDNVERLRIKIQNMGIEKLLFSKGAKPSSEVDIFGFRFNI